MQIVLKQAALTMAISSLGAAILGTQPAYAAYSVQALAETGVYIYGEYARGYNVPSYDGSYPGGPGFSSIGGGCGANYSVCSVGGSGNMEKSPNLTAVTEATSVNVTTLPSYYYPQGLTASGSAYATANLAKGSVGIADQGTYLDCCGVGSGQAGGHGVSVARADDTLHFSVAGASAQTMTTIAVAFRVHGATTAFTPAGDSTADLSTVLQLGGGYFQANILSNGSTNYLPILSEGPPPSGWLTESLSPDLPGDFTFHGTLALTGATQDLGIVEYLFGNCGDGTSCDYAHTASVSFTLPSNVTYTSDSGVFLTQPTSGVPEPASWGLMLAGVALTGARLRRRGVARRVAG